MREQRTYPTEAIILKQSNLGEADRILTLFTPYKGKFSAVAKGIRRPISKKTGHLELLCRSQLHIAVGRNLDIVTQAQGLESFLHMREELWHLTCGLYLTELVERFIEENTPHTDVYKLLLEALRTLDNDALEVQKQRKETKDVLSEEQTSELNAQRDRTRLLMRYFEIYLLSSVGYEPVLRTCANCDTELEPEENGFTPSLGGALCPNCSHLWSQSLSMNALKVLRLLHRSDWSQVPRFRLDARLHTELERAMHGLLRFHLERDLKSWSFLETIR
jgi:DNA repair protein RecO (recombination protein O)